jgi:hypothetical protein
VSKSTPVGKQEPVTTRVLTNTSLIVANVSFFVWKEANAHINKETTYSISNFGCFAVHRNLLERQVQYSPLL